MLQPRPPLVTPQMGPQVPHHRALAQHGPPRCPAIRRAQPMLSRWHALTGHTDICDRARLRRSPYPSPQGAGATPSCGNKPHPCSWAMQARAPKLVSTVEAVTWAGKEPPLACREQGNPPPFIGRALIATPRPAPSCTMPAPAQGGAPGALLGVSPRCALRLPAPRRLQRGAAHQALRRGHMSGMCWLSSCGRSEK